MTCQHSGDVVGTVLQESESLKAQVQEEKTAGNQLRALPAASVRGDEDLGQSGGSNYEELGEDEPACG